MTIYCIVDCVTATCCLSLCDNVALTAVSMMRLLAALCTVAVQQSIADVLCCPLVSGTWKLQLSALRALQPFITRFVLVKILMFLAISALALLYWAALWPSISALNIQQLSASGSQVREPVLMKFGTQQQIKISVTVTWPNIKIGVYVVWIWASQVPTAQPQNRFLGIGRITAGWTFWFFGV